MAKNQIVSSQRRVFFGGFWCVGLVLGLGWEGGEGDVDVDVDVDGDGDGDAGM